MTRALRAGRLPADPDRATGQVRKVCQGRNEAGIEPQRCEILCFCIRWCLAPHIQQAKVEMGLGTIGVDHFRGHQFAVRGVERTSLILRHGNRIDAGERTGRFDAYCANGIAEQRGDRLNDGRRRRGRQCTWHCGSDERTGVRYGSLERSLQAGVA